MVRIGILGYGNSRVHEKKSRKRQDYDRGCSRCKRERNRKLER